MSKQVLVKNIASLTLVQIANYVLPLISVPIISRIIGPEKFGVLNFAAAFIAYFNILITYGFDLTATRRVAKDPTNTVLRNQIFNEVIKAKSCLFIASVSLFSICLYIMPPLREEKAVALFSFLVCLSTVLTQNWLFAAMQDLSKVALFEFVSKLLFTLSVLLVVRQKSDYVWQPLITGCVQIGVAAISFGWAFRTYKLTWVTVSLKQIATLLRTEATVFVSLILISLYTTTNVIILGFVQGPQPVGFYTAGQKLILVASSVLSIPLSQALFPFVGKAFAEDYQRGLVLIQKIVPVVLIATLSIGVLMVLFGPWALLLFYGASYRPAIIVFQLLAFAPVLTTLSGLFGTQIMLNLRMDKAFLTITGVVTFISLGTNFYLASHFSYIGSALNWLLTELLLVAFMYVFLRRQKINPIDLHFFTLKSIRTQLNPARLRAKPAADSEYKANQADVIS